MVVFATACSSINLKIDMKDNADVKTLQTILTKLQLYDGYCYGNFGTKTQESVKKFQSKNGCQVTGTVNEETCKKLTSIVEEKKWNISTSTTSTSSSSSSSSTTTTTSTANNNLKILTCSPDPKLSYANRSKGENVTILQTLLKELGYYVTYKDGSKLKVDGDFGPCTDWAVKEFQKAQGTLLVDGLVGEITCGKINEKIIAKVGASATTSSDKKTTAGTTTAVKTDPYKIDTSKNVLKTSQSNLHIQGINFIIADVTFNTAFNNASWNTIELMNGTNYVYKGRPAPRKYTITTYLKNSAYTKLKDELYKLQAQKCSVTGTDIEPSTYTVVFTVALQKMSHKKLTIELNECI